MSPGPMGRRSFLKGAGMALLTAAGGMARAPESGAAQGLVPDSSGTERPRLKAPPDGADCHVHIVDPQRFPIPPEFPEAWGELKSSWSNDTLRNYRLLQRRIGTVRAVIVTPTIYVADNRCTLDAVARLGANARGIAVVHPRITDAELKYLDSRSVRGVRYAVKKGTVPAIPLAMLESLAKRVAGLGWHIELSLKPDKIVENASMLHRLPTPIKFDHMGWLSTSPAGLKHPAYAVIRRLIDKGRTWVGLEGAYTSGSTKIAQAFVKAAPERLVWGSDWPHPEFKASDKPDDAMLFDLLAAWTPDEAVRRRILVTNPEVLYGFSKS